MHIICDCMFYLANNLCNMSHFLALMWFLLLHCVPQCGSCTYILDLYHTRRYQVLRYASNVLDVSTTWLGSTVMYYTLVVLYLLCLFS